MDADKTYGEKAKQELYKNATSFTEQILEAKSLETTIVRPLTPIAKTIKVRRTRRAVHCWRNKDELISDVFLWTPVCQCWSTNKNLLATALRGHRMQFGRLARSK